MSGTTSEEALKVDGSEGALLLLEYRNIRDKELKFLTGLSEATRSDGRIHAIFNSMGTKTGRFSCKDPNLQNIPKLGNGLFPVRSLFHRGETESHDEVIVECSEDDAEAVMAEVQSFMSARSAEIFNGQSIGVEARIADSWAGDVKVPRHADIPSYAT